MNPWPDTDGRIIERYLGRLRLRSPTSPIYYRQTLRSFQEVVARRQCSPSEMSRDVLEAWLRERAAQWPETTLLHRARIVDRFLDFLVQEGMIVSNPVANLRAEYHAKSDKTILRALLASDADQALESIRRFPPFGSVLGNLMRDHIALMQARGYRYQTQARWFWRFDRFLQAHPELAREPVSVMLQHWAAARRTANHAAECERLARALSKAQHHLDPDTKPRRPDPRPAQQVARQWRRPHIYSPEDVRRLLDIARTYPSPRAPLRPLSLYTMLVLAYCAGLRLGEVARLNLADVDLVAGTITIRETKFFKSRILPLADSALSALREYLEARRQEKAPQSPDSGLFWHDQGNARYTSHAIAGCLVDILRWAGMKPAKGKAGPRIHDLRHSFVVNRILEWYRSGINPQDKLPFLATYLGHRDIHSTLVYITVTQELLQEASERFRTFGAPCLLASEEVQP
ncbi:integrase [Sinorhizobium meliloti]|uniref:tyrosine-type recombinase/integrase n=1 Tax=Rhizobium meliloti TaxID=382 RepID=UPI0002A5744B|nr:tyrosine-type recombinase/integrase [Sinorhizobium meliloti]AGA08740.1 Site-specific recombinase XerD [Sinorhizobium meliloti GR4]MDE4618710.1 tyrosine-type recombinase/integrase [Sinorhizobium meliloti]RVL02577.1 integrase [Sinorhizobium meliloti]RVM92106.1 integrase [Sinorhizobium meliloti]RVN07377.1 integrase [Sinorhizobium meliloti]